MMTAAQIRQSFLDFFREKKHTIVPSSSLMPDSPNLLFTNAGMNQFVPIFLGERSADVSKWAGAVPSSDTRAADTQKCIRAGGKHNDLDDVGLDTYHHTFFEMLGNWSFGDYFKKEAIGWAWELIIERWKFPAERVYATIYQPDKSKGDPADRDQEAWELWAEKFRSIGLDPDIHIVNGNKKDNFWMMGDTGPCGPCTEIHVDLTPGPVNTSVERQREGAKLVNGPDARCIEIWNNVFIQYNANPDGTFSPLPAQHVDTGMGFERVVSIIHGTKNFTDFENAKISNYETDVFRPIFDEIEKMSGKRYGSTLPAAGTTGETEQEKEDVAFRVIADHIRTLSFAIADGISPGNNDRNYVLRRILRRAVRYGRALGFREPFFYKLVDVLARTMGDIFPNLRERLQFVKDTLKREEESFNKTLDKGIALFENEAARITNDCRGVAPAPSQVGPGAPAGTPQNREAQSSQGATYRKRNLPHFERPWAKYAVTFSTVERRPLSEIERDEVMRSTLYAHDHQQYVLYVSCVMADHVHLLFEPQVKETAADGTPVFYTLEEIMQGIKSTTAHRINKLRGEKGPVWDKESYDRYMRSDADLEEKFLYACDNPRKEGLEDYPWVWTWDMIREGRTWFPRFEQFPPAPLRGEDGASRVGGVPAGAPGPTCEGAGATPRQVSGAFAFRLYDEQGFPLDLTELMARERGLTVDTAGFEKHMEEQRTRARAAQKKTVIELSEVETKEATRFLGYNELSTTAKVLEVVALKDKTAVILDASTAYAEMGGQIGDSGEISAGANSWRIANTTKVGHTWLHFLESSESMESIPSIGAEVTLTVDRERRAAIQRHHTVTHLLHWALHEVVSKDATQKGSSVAPDKLTFDFNSAALTPQQVRDIERLVNERILENAPVVWNEVPYADVRGRADIMQFFGDKYGEIVRVVDIGGYSKELCAGTHTRATGEIGLFRIASEAAIAAGVRRIEAAAGLTAYDNALRDSARLVDVAAKIGSPIGDLEKKLEALLAQQKELEKSLKSAQQREAAGRAKTLLASAENNAIVANLGDLDGDSVMHIAEALKSSFPGIVVLGAASGGAVTLIAAVGKEFQSKVQAGKIIQTIAPIVGGKGGGKPDFARGGGKDASKLDAALAAAKGLF
jgi:alanyl-tRNA synthetase